LFINPNRLWDIDDAKQPCHIMVGVNQGWMGWCCGFDGRSTAAGPKAIKANCDQFNP
jgi:hypothetical protein